MSRSSSKQHYTQLMEWLAVRKQTTSKTSNNQSSTRFSKADLYNGKASRVGN
jgi:hypothetical protein